MYQKVILQHETRKVDKYGYISFCIRKYETKPALIGYKVEIPYNSAAPETITASYPRYGSFHRRIQSESENSVTKTRLFLDALERKHSEFIYQMADSISFASYKKKAKGIHEAFFGMGAHTVDWQHESNTFRETLRQLYYVVDRQMFTLVTEDPCCGKSRLIRRFYLKLPRDEYIILYLSDSELTPW